MMMTETVQEYGIRLPGSGERVREVRGLLGRCLGTRHPCLDEAQLLTTEAVTNAIRHSASGRPGGCFTVSLEWTPETARVSVLDEGSSTAPTLLTGREESGSGRGVDLIDRLADRWGFIRHAGETTVWFELQGAGAAHVDALQQA